MVTQLGECKTEDLEVAGSSPAHGTILFIQSGKMADEEILLNVDSDEYTLGQIMQMVNKYQDEHPDMEVFLDGDRRAIVGRRIEQR